MAGSPGSGLGRGSPGRARTRLAWGACRSRLAGPCRGRSRHGRGHRRAAPGAAGRHPRGTCAGPVLRPPRTGGCRQGDAGGRGQGEASPAGPALCAGPPGGPGREAIPRFTRASRARPIRGPPVLSREDDAGPARRMTRGEAPRPYPCSVAALYAWLRCHPRLVDSALAAALGFAGVGSALAYGPVPAAPGGARAGLPIVFRRAHPSGAFAAAAAVGALQVRSISR